MIGRIMLRALAVVISAAGFAAMVAWYGFIEPPFLSYRDLPFEPTVAEVAAGETIPLRETRCSSSDEEEDYLIARWLIRLDPAPGDVIRVILPGGGLVPISPGCNVGEISKANAVPADTPPGIYFISGHAKVDGKWRTSKVPWTSRPFRVRSPAAASAPAP